LLKINLNLFLVQLLHKLNIRAEEGAQKLLRFFPKQFLLIKFPKSVIKNPVAAHLPIGCKKYLASVSATNLVTNMAELVPPESREPIVIVVGGIAHGKVC
jgi:rRNA pseudouridine-1189 N-methylase Emg1 (Nep1/Mra1 family)